MHARTAIHHSRRTRPATRTRAGRSPVARRPRRTARGVLEHQGTLAQLIDAKAAARLLGVPYTWILAQAREGRIPHHRLGHYVRFDVKDLKRWLTETRIGPGAGRNA